MKKQIANSVLKFFFALTFTVALALSAATVLPSAVKADTLPVAEVTGIEVRGNGADSNFIVLKNAMYSSVAADTTVADPSAYNTKSKVKFYTSAEDTVGKYLTEICGGWWTQNMWGSGGLMLAFNNPADYNTYNGTTIYKITIEAGCELPCGDSVYVTDKEVSYINKQFGDSSVKDGAYSWAKYVKPVEVKEATGVEVRSGGGNFNFIVLKNAVYSSVTADTTVDDTFVYNTSSKVKIYTSAEDTVGKYLTEICGGWWTQNMWGSGGLMLAFNNPADYNTYNGTTIYKITIEAGCELPCGDSVYVTDKEVSYINKQFGDSSVKDGAYSWAKYVKPVEVKEVTGVEVRSGGGDFNFIVLKNAVYSSVTANTTVDDTFVYNTKSKVKIYTSAEDIVGKYLTEICGGWWTQNMWGSGGLMLAFNNPDDYNTYNGTTVYKITIEAGCELPCGDSAYVTDKEVSFFNREFGAESVKAGAYSWAKYVKPVETREITGVQVRSGGGNFNFIVLQSAMYSSVTADTTVDDTFIYNTRSKVKIYTSAEDTVGKYLTGICGGWWTQNKWGSGGLMLAFNNPDDYNTYNGATIYKIVIEAGCELPCGTSAYVTGEERVFYNESYGYAKDKASAMTWTQNQPLPVEYVTGSVKGVQARGIPQNAWYHFLVVQSSVFDGITKADSLALWKHYLTEDKITIYTKDENGAEVGISLKDLAMNHAGINIFDNGSYLNFNEYAATYNGKTITKVLIEKDCLLPGGAKDGKYIVLKVDKDYTFINGNYGEKDAEFSATTKWTREIKKTTQEISIDGVQMRGGINNWYYYLVLRSSAYDGLTSTEDTFTTKFSSFDKIKLYTSENDTTGTALSALNIVHVERNFKSWATGLFINFSEFDSTFGGHQVYKIVIERGCELLGDYNESDAEAKVFVADDEYVFYNESYGYQKDKLSAMDWSEEQPLPAEYVTGSVSGVQARGIPQNAWYHFLVVQSSVFDGITKADSLAFWKRYLTEDKITIYTKDENGAEVGVSLKDLTMNHAGINIFDNGSYLNFNEYAEKYNGKTITKVVIGKDCLLPGGEKDGKYIVLKVDKDYTFINGNYGAKDAEFSANTNWEREIKKTTQEISIDGVQMRGGINNWYYYLVLRSSAYDGLTSTEDTFTTRFTSFDKIKLYTSENDTTGTALSALNIVHVERNFKSWATGLFINFSEFDSTFGGHQVYKIVIERGCELLGDYNESDAEAKVFVADDEYVFYNESYGYQKDKLSAMDWSEEQPLPVEYVTGSVSGVQARGLPENAWYHFLVVQSSVFDGITKADSLALWKRYLTEDKITIYTKDENGAEVGVSLKDLTMNHAGINIFDNGSYLNFNEYAATYNGKTITKVVIGKDCLLPGGAKDGKYIVLKVDNDYTFYNNSYGDESKKYENFDWSEYEMPETIGSFGTAIIDTVTNQCGDNRYLIIRLNEKFDMKFNAKFFETRGYSNILDKVLLYSGNDLTVEPVKLRDVWTGEITLRQYGSPTDIGFSIKNEDKWNGTNLFAVKILAGCQIPFVKDGEFGNKVVEKEVTFRNTHYGLSGDIPGAFDSQYGTARTYENFAVKWAKAAIVEYTVEGLDGVSYDKECLISGSVKDASDFAIEGYDVTIYDNLGYAYYGEIIVPDQDTVITLKYTVAKPNSADTENQGCVSGVGGGNVLILLSAIAAAGVVFSKRKKNLADRNNEN